MFEKLTPVLVVAAIEPILPFWTALGFKVTTEVPHGEKLGFVILEADGIEVMYQTVGSVREDEKAVLEGPRELGASSLFIQVSDVEKVASKLPAHADVIVKRRTTFYGSTETIVRDPAGNVLIFAQMKGQ